MSDFDRVLERLVADQDFRATLAADPDAALGGYHLDDQERALLRSQLDLGTGADRVVEERVNKSGLFGMVGPVVSALGFVSPADGGGGPVPGHLPDDASHYAPAPQPVEAYGVLSVGDVHAPPHATLDPGGPTATLEVGHDPTAGKPAVGYHTRVDAGDGRWDAYVAVERDDGGVDILVDRDGDGVVDWIGHDLNRDGLIESADVDLDHDGVFETHFVDDNGDGWLDRRV
jgi:hypothetical protein